MLQYRHHQRWRQQERSCRLGASCIQPADDQNVTGRSQIRNVSNEAIGVISTGSAINRALSGARTHVEDPRWFVGTRVDLKPKVHLGFEQLDPGIGFNGADQDCILGAEIVHAQVARIAHYHAGGDNPIQLSETSHKTQVDHAGVTPGAQLKDLRRAWVAIRFDIRPITPVEIALKSYGTLDQSLHDHQTVVGRHDEGIAIRAEKFGPQSCRCSLSRRSESVLQKMDWGEDLGSKSHYNSESQREGNP